MLINILDVYPKISGVPTEPLRRAAEALKEAAEAAAGNLASAARTRNQYIQSVLPGAGPPPPLAFSVDVDRFKQAVKTKISQQYGKKGPTENAFQQLDWLANRAKGAGYPLDDATVQNAFMDFIMSYVTDGFVGEDTTGTQMGNYQGSWRGGGFMT